MSWEEFIREAWAYGLVAALAIVLIGSLNARRRGRMFTMLRLRRGHWTWRTVIVHFFVSHFFAFLAIRFMNELRLFDYLLSDPENGLRRANLASPLAYVMFLAVSFTSLYLVNGDSVARVGLSVFRWRPNAILGASAFVVATPIV